MVSWDPYPDPGGQKLPTNIEKVDKFNLLSAGCFIGSGLDPDPVSLEMLDLDSMNRIHSSGKKEFHSTCCPTNNLAITKIS